MYQSLSFSPFPWRPAERVEPDGSVQVLDRDGRPCGIRLDPKKQAWKRNHELAVASPFLYLALRALKSAVLESRKCSVPEELLGRIAREFDAANDDADLAISLVEDNAPTGSEDEVREYFSAFAKKVDAGFKADAEIAELREALRTAVDLARKPGPDSEAELLKLDELLARPVAPALQDPADFRPLSPLPVEVLAGELAERLRAVLIWARVYAKLYDEIVPKEARSIRMSPRAAVLAAERTLEKIDFPGAF
ncbi:MAG: hypothetical protein IMZ57_11010 [Acidobacteria bacterium]|nr:hypothetical protein [Acidobacteriota bacterium]